MHHLRAGCEEPRIRPGLPWTSAASSLWTAGQRAATHARGEVHSNGHQLARFCHPARLADP